MHHYSEKMKWWQIILATLFFMLILSIPVMSLVGLIANENAEARTEAPNVEIIEDVEVLEQEQAFVPPVYGADIKPGNPDRIILEDDAFYIEGVTDTIILEDDGFILDVPTPSGRVELPPIYFD